ncbi:MAG: SDR family NAD(P)-dependent oxidoreductase, partial [Clostridia bacterium]|nr:SDR family NAD(P)-dependent oxidoreductase [Clostridia bacterium]
MQVFQNDMLAGQCAVVTGAARGIGRAIAAALAGAGADIAIVDRAEPEMAAETIAQVEACGRKAVFYYGDVTDYAGCEALVKQIVTDFGKIDILVNNAGITKDMLMPQMGEAEFDAVISVNLKGTFQMMRHVSRQMMRKKYGRIVNISSVAGIMGNAGQVNYAASKAGVIGMTKSAAKELA